MMATAIFADYDNDGLVDIYVSNNGQQVEEGKGNTVADEAQGVGVLYRNESKTKNRWLKVRLEGTKSNRDAYRAEVTATAGDLVLIPPLISELVTPLPMPENCISVLECLTKLTD